MALFLLIKGLKRLEFDYEESLGLSFGITFGVALGVSFLAYCTLIVTGVVERYVDRSVADTKGDPLLLNQGDTKGDAEAVEAVELDTAAGQEDSADASDEEATSSKGKL